MMALILNKYSPSFSQGTIWKQERHQHQHSCIDPSSAYPSDVALVGCMEGPMHHQDALSEFYNVDAIWGFAILTAADLRDRMDCWNQNPRLRGSIILHHLLVMGTYDWVAPSIFQQGNFPLLAIRYASVLGNQLLLRIKRSKALVGVQ